MHFLESLSAKLGLILALYGGWGLFAISFLDSSFLSFPVVNDLLLIHLSSRRPSMALLYVLQCSIGSMLGAYTIYALARRGANSAWRISSSGRMKRVEQWLERNDFVCIVVASLLPPPAPFKIFAITAGMLRLNPLRFCSALLVGRTLRFSVEGLLGARYGSRAEGYLKGNVGAASLVVSVLLVVITLLQRRFRRRLQEDPPSVPGSDHSKLR